MRKQIAAANWKMNLDYEQADQLLTTLINKIPGLQDHQEVIFAVPFPYLEMAGRKIEGKKGFYIAAQNCHHEKSGAFTGEVSIEMIRSMNIRYCLVGHSERREYNHETNLMLATKTDNCLANQVTPVFCCGEPLATRESGKQNDYVSAQIAESLFHLPASIISSIIIAYEPIWAIGTGKTATTAQAQEMHQHLRSVLAGHFGDQAADQVSILYGGSVKPNNVAEIFNSADVDGGLVGGASLVAADFIAIVQALK